LGVSASAESESDVVADPSLVDTSVFHPLGAIPSNLLLQKSPAATYLGFNIFMWGALLMAQAASHNFATLLALRFLSGAAEAIADPAFMLITSMFYTR
jgi:MFS family permease